MWASRGHLHGRDPFIRSGDVHPQAPRGEDPHFQGRPRRRAQAGHGALRGPEGLDGIARGPRSRGGAKDHRSGARADDGSRPPLRGHGQSGDGRRDHGPLRRAAGSRGPRDAGLLCRAADAERGRALRRGHPQASRGRRPDPGRPQLRRCRSALDQQRPPHGLHGGRPDDAPGGADGAARPPRHHPHHRDHPARGRGVRPGETARAHADQGPGRAHCRLRGRGCGHGPHALAGLDGPGAHLLRGSRRGGRSAPPGARAGRQRPGPDRGGGGGARRRQVAPVLRVHPLAPDPGLARAGVELGVVRQGDSVLADGRPPQGLLQDRGAGRHARGARQGDRQRPHPRRGIEGQCRAAPVGARRAPEGPRVHGARRGHAPHADARGRQARAAPGEPHSSRACRPRPSCSR